MTDRHAGPGPCPASALPLRIVPARPEHVETLARTLRAEDKAEIEALGFSVREGLFQSCRTSLWVRTALLGDEVACVWGVGSASLLSGEGGPWMISAPPLARIRKRFLLESRREVASMRALFPTLSGLVDARYGGAVRWMRWLGFEMAETVMVNGVPFYRYQLKENRDGA